jgi:hypothetical protein
MKTISFKIYDLSAELLAELRKILAHAFGDGAQITEDGVVTVQVPVDWDETVAINMIKSLFAHIELRYAPRGPRP